MYCKNCGKQLDNSAKFCDGCGTQTNTTQVSQPANQNNTQATPRQFGYNNNLDGKKEVQYQKSAFRGKQWNAGSSGGVQFNRERKGGLLGKLIKFGFIVGVIIVGVIILSSIFGGCDGVCDIAMSTDYNPDTHEPIDATNEFVYTTDYLYLTFNAEGYDIGSSVEIVWIYSETEIVIAEDSAVTSVDGANAALFSLSAPFSGWPAGDYEVEIYVNGDYVDSAYFEVIE